MKKGDKKYVDQQITWVRELKRTENYWLEKYLEAEQRTQKEEMKAFRQSIEGQLILLTDRINKLELNSVTRREMRTGIISAITLMIMFLGLLVAIFLKK